MIRRLMSSAVSGNIGSCGPLVTARQPAPLRPTLSTTNPGGVEGFYSLATKLSAPPSMEAFFETIGQRSLQARKPLAALFEWLERYDQAVDGPALSLLINGTNGSGKSAVLLQAADILSRTKGDNSIVLYHGQTSRFTHGHYPYYPIPGDGTTTTYEQPELGADLVKTLVEQNPTAKDIHVNDHLLGTLYEQCLKNPLDGHKIFLNILQHFKTNESWKCHFLLDNVNSLFGSTQYKHPDGTLVAVKDLPLLQALLDCFLRPTRSLTAIGATTHSDPLIGRHHQLKQSAATVCTMLVPEMTKSEAQILFQFLHDIGYLSPTTTVDRVFVEHKHFMTGGNARLLFESAMYDDIYN